MPLRDHFRPPLDDIRAWENFHAQWPAMIVLALSRKLPRRYIAAPSAHAGSYIEIDVGTFEEEDADSSIPDAGNGNGGVATAVLGAPAADAHVCYRLP